MPTLLNLTRKELNVLEKRVVRKVVLRLLMIGVGLGWLFYFIADPQTNLQLYWEMIKSFGSVFGGRALGIQMHHIDWESTPLISYLTAEWEMAHPGDVYIWDMVKWIFCAAFPWLAIYWLFLYAKATIRMFGKNVKGSSIPMSIEQENGMSVEAYYVWRNREMLSKEIKDKLGNVTLWMFFILLGVPVLFPNLGTLIIYGGDPMASNALFNCDHYGWAMWCVLLLINMLKPIWGLVIGAAWLMIGEHGRKRDEEARRRREI